ncbi:MAG TPA: endonuclease/exonuclease/phosphatase family protein [Solirubrobacteraceae bacterium]|nr:endonuclease/exonuclease/phosphatase family protein [Solirubrobacteraceae bacterium]
MRPKLTLLITVLVAALAIPSAAHAKTNPKITVMTRNVFLGADLGPAINAPTLAQAIDGAGVIWNELQSTKFAERAVPLAREIKRSRADLVGLQEVALWRIQTPSDLGAPPSGVGAPATQVSQDFLAILREELGRSYRVVVVQNEFDAELPVDQDGSNSTGGFEGADFDARLTMRDVVLVRRGSKVKLGKTRRGHFDTRYEPNIGGVVLPVDRGWASVEATLRGHKFRFVDTHLEAFGDPAIREAQAKELTRGPLKTSKQVILVGDLNSGVGRHKQPEQAGDDLAFRALARFGMKDNGAVQSCCYSNLFDPNAVFDHTVDHVLSKPGLRKVKATVTGDDAGQRTASGLWPSDHGGVVSTLRLRR